MSSYYCGPCKTMVPSGGHQCMVVYQTHRQVTTEDLSTPLAAENKKLKARIEKLEAALKWYAEWDWSDKYVQAVHKRAREVLEEVEKP